MSRRAHADHPDDDSVACEHTDGLLHVDRNFGVGEQVAYQARSVHAEWSDAVAFAPWPQFPCVFAIESGGVEIEDGCIALRVEFGRIYFLNDKG